MSAKEYKWEYKCPRCSCVHQVGTVFSVAWEDLEEMTHYSQCGGPSNDFVPALDDDTEDAELPTIVMVGEHSMGYIEVKCHKCGWVHAAVPIAAVSLDALEACLKCFRCGAPNRDFVLAGPGDAPVGCTLQPVVLPCSLAQELEDGKS